MPAGGRAVRDAAAAARRPQSAALVRPAAPSPDFRTDDSDGSDTGPGDTYEHRAASRTMAAAPSVSFAATPSPSASAARRRFLPADDDASPVRRSVFGKRFGGMCRGAQDVPVAFGLLVDIAARRRTAAAGLRVALRKEFDGREAIHRNYIVLLESATRAVTAGYAHSQLQRRVASSRLFAEYSAVAQRWLEEAAEVAGRCAILNAEVTAFTSAVQDAEAGVQELHAAHAIIVRSCGGWWARVKTRRSYNSEMRRRHDEWAALSLHEAMLTAWRRFQHRRVAAPQRAVREKAFGARSEIVRSEAEQRLEIVCAFVDGACSRHSAALWRQLLAERSEAIDRCEHARRLVLQRTAHTIQADRLADAATVLIQRRATEQFSADSIELAVAEEASAREVVIAEESAALAALPTQRHFVVVCLIQRWFTRLRAAWRRRALRRIQRVARAHAARTGLALARLEREEDVARATLSANELAGSYLSAATTTFADTAAVIYAEAASATAVPDLNNGIAASASTLWERSCDAHARQLLEEATGEADAANLASLRDSSSRHINRVAAAFCDRRQLGVCRALLTAEASARSAIATEATNEILELCAVAVVGSVKAEYDLETVRVSEWQARTAIELGSDAAVHAVRVIRRVALAAGVRRVAGPLWLAAIKSERNARLVVRRDELEAREEFSRHFISDEEFNGRVVHRRRFAEISERIGAVDLSKVVTQESDERQDVEAAYGRFAALAQGEAAAIWALWQRTRQLAAEQAELLSRRAAAAFDDAVDMVTKDEERSRQRLVAAEAFASDALVLERDAGLGMCRLVLEREADPEFAGLDLHQRMLAARAEAEGDSSSSSSTASKDDEKASAAAAAAGGGEDTGPIFIVDPAPEPVAHQPHMVSITAQSHLSSLHQSTRTREQRMSISTMRDFFESSDEDEEEEEDDNGGAAEQPAASAAAAASAAPVSHSPMAGTPAAVSSSSSAATADTDDSDDDDDDSSSSDDGDSLVYNDPPVWV